MNDLTNQERFHSMSSVNGKKNQRKTWRQNKICAMLFFQVLPFADKNNATWWVQALTHQIPLRRFCMLFFEVLPFTTLASSVNGKTSKKSVQK